MVPFRVKVRPVRWAAAHGQYRVQFGGRFLGAAGSEGHVQIQFVFVKFLRVRGFLIRGQAQLQLDAAVVPAVLFLAGGNLPAVQEGDGQGLLLLAFRHGSKLPASPTGWLLSVPA